MQAVRLELLEVNKPCPQVQQIFWAAILAMHILKKLKDLKFKYKSQACSPIFTCTIF